MKRRALLMVAALAFAGGACGGDDDDAATDDASATSDDADAADAGDDGDDGSDSGNNEWCGLMERVDTPAFDQLDITDPESVENAFQEVVDLIDDAADSAPDEIEDDVRTLADQFEAFLDELEDADFNFDEIDQTAFDSPEADAAGERIDEFCGLDPDAGEIVTTDDATETDDGSDLGDVDEGAIRDQLVAQFELLGMTEDQASCLIDNMDLEDLAASGNQVDPSMFVQLYETCGIDLGG